MAYRRFRGRRTRRKARYVWVRDFLQAASPTNPQSFDLLSNYRSQFGLNFMLPDIVVWRIHIKISVSFTIAAFAANQGILVAVFNEDPNLGSIPAALTNQYNERYLMWDMLHLSPSVIESGVTTTPVVYRDYDIKSHRRFQNQNETLMLQVQGNGITAMTELFATYSVLLRLP